MKSPQLRLRIPERVSPLWAVITVAGALALGLSLMQINQLKGLYQSEVATGASTQQKLNELASERGLKKIGATGTIRYKAEATPLVVNAPDSYKFLVKTDVVSKRVATTELELVSQTNNEYILSSQPLFGSINIKAHQDVFKSKDTIEWIKNETGSQIDTTKLIEETRVGDTWKILKEENTFAGHKISYFLLKNGIGYRIVFYQLGNYEEFEQNVRLIMEGIAILQ